MNQRRPTWLAEAWIVIALVLLPLLFWWRLWALDPNNRAVIPEGDFGSQYYPLQLFAARELAAGRLPTWDPYLNSGQPGLADIQTGTFYPLNLLPNLFLAWFGLPYSLGLLTAQVILHFSLASLFTYLFVRQLALRLEARLAAARFAGVVAALSFTYSGYLTSFPVQQVTILETAVWLPLVLYFLERARYHPGGARWLILAGMALACGLLAGHPQTAMYLVYCSVGYGLFLAWPKGRPDLPRLASFGLLPLLIGAALAAVQLLPSLGFILRSTRAGLDYEAVSWGLPLAELTHLLYPGYFGGSPQYVGILPPVLAITSLFSRQGRRQALFWISAGFLALFLAFGGHTFLYSLAYLLVPGFGAVRNQERVLYLFAFAVSVLAGLGALVLVQPVPLGRRRGFRRLCCSLVVVWSVFVALTALFYYGYLEGLQSGVAVNLFEGTLRHHMLLLLILGGAVILFALRRAGTARRLWLMILTLGLIWLNLFTINWRYNLADPAAEGAFPESDLVRFLKQQPGTFRIASAGLLPGGASAGVVYQLEDITANTPMGLAAYQQFADRVGNWRRWQLLNVHYLLRQREMGGPGLEEVYSEGEVKVFRLTDPMPRAWLVHNVVMADDEEGFELLNAEDFDLRSIAILPPASSAPALPGGAATSVTIVAAEPGQLVVALDSSRPGLLVISQPFYPGWRAWIDGKPAPLQRANVLLQGVAVPAGSHRIRVAYRISPLGGGISLLALAACLAGVALRRRRV